MKVLIFFFILTVFLCIFTHCGKPTGSSGFLVDEADFIATIFVVPEGRESGEGSVSGPVSGIHSAWEMARTILQNAREAQAGIPKGGVLLILREGMYELDSPLLIDPENGPYPLTIRAYPGERPVLSGGVKLPDTWKVGMVNGRETWTQTLQDVAEGNWYFRQLWVNGQRARVPVLPKSGFYQVEDLVFPTVDQKRTNLWAQAFKDRIVFRPGDLSANWHNRDDVWIMLSNYWFHNYFTLLEVDEEKYIARFQRESSFPLIVAHPAHGNHVNNRFTAEPGAYEPVHYRVHNVYEALSEPGEFYLDRNTGNLTYIPREGEQPETVEVIAPRLQQLLIVKGRPEKKVENIVLDGITFSHTIITPEKHAGTGNNYGSSGEAVIRLEGTANSTILNCEFSHLGEFALEMIRGSRDIDVTGNEFFDLGSGAITTYGEFGDRQEAAQITPGTTMRLRITDNRIHAAGRFFPAHLAVNINKTRNSVIAFNEISDHYFNGIHLGARYGRDLDFSIVDNQVLHNHIHTLGQGHWSANDFAGIYANGVGLGVEIRGNVIHDINCSVYGGSGIYLDQTPCYMVMRDNLIYRCNYDGFHIKGFENYIINNIVYDCPVAFGQVGSVPGAEPLAFVEHNIFVPGPPSAVYGSLHVPALSLSFIATNNLIWSTEPEAGLKVTTVAEGGGHRRENISFEEWRTRTGQDSGSIVAPPGFRNPVKDDFRLTKNSGVRLLRQMPVHERVGFTPFKVKAGPRPPSERNPVQFRKDNEALESTGFKRHVEMILKERMRDIDKTTPPALVEEHVQ